MERGGGREGAPGHGRRASARRARGRGRLLVLRAAALVICLAALLLSTSAAPPPGWEDPVTAVLSPAMVETRPQQVLSYSLTLWPTARSWPTSPLDSLALHLEIPPGFQLVPASLRIGEAAPLSLPAASLKDVALPPLSARGPLVLHWAIRGSRDVPAERHLMEARVKRGDAWVSPNAFGFIEVLDSAVIAASTIRGCVFRDLDGSGTREPGEEGLDGVLLTLDDAATAVTAADGAFSFAEVAGGTHVVRMDASSLAGDPRVDGGPRRTLELTAGLPSWVEFAVSFPCDELAWSDRQLWGGYFLLERADDRERYDFLRECPPPIGTDAPALARSPDRGTPAYAAAGSPAARSSARSARDGRRAQGLERYARRTSGTSGTSEIDGAGRASGASGSSGARGAKRGAASVSPEAALRRVAGSSADLGTVTIEVGERLFVPSTDRLQPAYEDLLGRLGTLLEQKGLSAELRTAAGDRRDAPPNPILEERRRKAVEMVMGDAVEGGGRRARRPRAEGEAPPATLEGMSLEDAPGRSRLVLTFSGEVPFASGYLPASPAEGRGQPLFILLVVHAKLPQGFHLPDVAGGSPLSRLNVDAVTEDESLIFLLEPAAGVTPRVRTLRGPFRLVVELAGARGSSAPSVGMGNPAPGRAAEVASGTRAG